MAIDTSKRNLLLSGAAGLLTASLIKPLSANASRPGKFMHFYNVATKERASVFYSYNGGLSYSDRLVMEYILRDRRENSQIIMDVGLYDELFNVQTALNAHDKEIQILSGYRTHKTNEMLRRRSKAGGVAKNSLHMKGQAIDLYIKDIPLSRLHSAALDTTFGGVGYYPHSGFVHIDTGHKRNWRGS